MKEPGSRISGLHRTDCADLALLELENSETGEIELVPDYPAIAKRYAEVVASGQLPTNSMLVLQAQRYLDMLVMAEDPKNFFFYSPLHLIDYCRFAERLCHFEDGNWQLNQVDGRGDPDPSIILEPFEIWIESAIHGFRKHHPSRDGRSTRLVKKVIEVIPRKNAKSLRATRAALYELCCSGGMAPEIPIAAFSSKQSDDTLYGDLVKMLNADEALRTEFGIVVTRDEIRCGTGRIFKLTQHGERLDGLNPSLALFEEGHSGAALVYKVVNSAFGARPNALLRMITTAGQDNTGPAFELIKQAEMTLKGTIEDYTIFAALFTLDRDEYINPENNALDWKQLLAGPRTEDLIARCNPMFGVALDKSEILQECMTAYKFRPDLRGELARTRFNIWTNAGTTLIDPLAWGNCKRKVSLDQFIGKRCWIGVDLAEQLDMCALVLLFEMPGGEIVVFGQFYLPEDSPTAHHPELAEYIRDWEEQGHLFLTPGPLADHDLVREHVENFCEMFDVQVIACDPWQSHNTVSKLWAADRPVMVYPNSEKTMTAPTDDILGRIAVQTIWHDGNPVLAWHFGNVCGERRGNGGILPRKEAKNSLRKIDGFVAGCFANGVRMQPDVAKPAMDVPLNTDPYRHRGLIGFDEMTGATNG